jgi:plasmid stabilization system protein ParE
MPQLIWSPAALRDIQRLYRFIAPKNPLAATRAVRAIREGMQIVAEHPEAGKPMESMSTEYREWLIGFGDSGYVAVYRLEGDLAVVLAVRHQREAGAF